METLKEVDAADAALEVPFGLELRRVALRPTSGGLPYLLCQYSYPTPT
jgi:hypothetical protein